MLDHVRQIVVWVVFILTVSVILLNAVYMLASPKAWFSLPKWLKLQGVLTIERYGAGWGALQVRVLGAIFILTIFCVGFRLLAHK
jgi:hypothetical protein